MSSFAKRGSRRGIASLLSAPALATVAALGVGVAQAQDGGFEIEEGAEYGDEQKARELSNPESRIELGLLYNFSDDDLFGNYNGFLNEAPYFLGNVDLRQRDLFGWGDDYYARVQGLNLGLSSRFVGAEAGRQGLFGLRFEFDQLPVQRSETAQTFFSGVGEDDLSLPTPWTPGNNGTEMTDLPTNLRDVQIRWDRERLSGVTTLQLPSNFAIDLRYDHETKKGRKLSGAMMGLTGGNPRSVVVPQPVNYVTQQIEAALQYRGEDFQATLGYYGSAFDDQSDDFTWENPYLAQAAWNPTAGYNGSGLPACVGVVGCGMGRKHQPPDNWFNQILASAGYNLPYRTRITASGAFGWMTQDDHFLPYTINPTLTAITQSGAPTIGTDTAALPRRSLDGEIFTTVVDVRTTSKPLEKLDLGAGYHLDNRDNNTPRDVYVYIRGDAEDQGSIDSEQARLNLPYSFTQHRVDAEAGYEIWRRTKLTLGYEWALTKRDYQEVDELTENTLSAGLISQPFSFVNTRVNYEHAWRNGDDYEGNRPFLKGHTGVPIAADRASCLAAGLYPSDECPFENHPLLRKSYLANRERDEVMVSLMVVPHEDVTIDMNVNWANEDYEDSELGVTNVWFYSPGVDVSWAPTRRFSTHAFYNFQKYRTHQKGWSYSNIGQSVLAARKWRSSDTDLTHTMGAGFDFAVVPDRLDIGADYLYADSRGRTRVSAGSALGPVVSYPLTKSEQHNVSARAEFHLNENLSIRLGYLYERFRYEDWALDGIGPTSLSCSANACVIPSGRNSEGYDAHVGSWSLVFRFW